MLHHSETSLAFAGETIGDDSIIIDPQAFLGQEQ